jgi:spore coat protein U-like protein
LLTRQNRVHKGDESNASAPLRQLSNGTDVLSYALYSDSARTTVWGGTGVAAPTPTGTAQTSTVYGRIAAGQNKPVGEYADTVTATDTF